MKPCLKPSTPLLYRQNIECFRRVQTPLRMPQNRFLWVAAIYHALVIFTITHTSQLIPSGHQVIRLQNISPITCGDWNKRRQDDSRMATQQIRDQVSSRSKPWCPDSAHSSLSSTELAKRRKPHRGIWITWRWPAGSPSLDKNDSCRDLLL